MGVREKKSHRSKAKIFLEPLNSLVLALTEMAEDMLELEEYISAGKAVTFCVTQVTVIVAVFVYERWTCSGVVWAHAWSTARHRRSAREAGTRAICLGALISDRDVIFRRQALVSESHQCICSCVMSTTPSKRRAKPSGDRGGSDLKREFDDHMSHQRYEYEKSATYLARKAC